MSVTLADGFVAAGLSAGIKTGSRRDVSLLVTDDGKPVPAAAVFTQNKFRAPPVEASLERLNVSGGMASGVIVNSGNANAGTGPKHALLALGYAGWGAGQLESEIQANGWLNVTSDAELLFDESLGNKWERAMARLGIDLPLLSGEAGHA